MGSCNYSWIRADLLYKKVTLHYFKIINLRNAENWIIAQLIPGFAAILFVVTCLLGTLKKVFELRKTIKNDIIISVIKAMGLYTLPFIIGWSPYFIYAIVKLSTKDNVNM